MQNHDAEDQDARAQEAEFKHSASVQRVAKLTRLNLDQAYWLCVGLNFVVVAGAIIWASRKYLPGMLQNRTTAIQHAIQEARKTSEEANRRLSGIETRLTRLGIEIKEMHASAEREAANEEARIKIAAEEEARKIVAAAQQEIAAATRSARRDLTAYAADLAISLARKQIRVDPVTDEALVNGFVQQLERQAGSEGKN